MDYVEALDIVARARTQYQAFEKMDEVLKKAQGAENHVRELEKQRKDLQQAVSIEQVHLDDTVTRRNSMAAEYESRILQLNKAEGIARQKTKDAEESHQRSVADLHLKYLGLNTELQASHERARKEGEEQLEDLKKQANDIQHNIARMKELARSVA